MKFQLTFLGILFFSLSKIILSQNDSLWTPTGVVGLNISQIAFAQPIGYPFVSGTRIVPNPGSCFRE